MIYSPGQHPRLFLVMRKYHNHYPKTVETAWGGGNITEHLDLKQNLYKHNIDRESRGERRDTVVIYMDGPSIHMYC